MLKLAVSALVLGSAIGTTIPTMGWLDDSGKHPGLGVAPHLGGESSLEPAHARTHQPPVPCVRKRWVCAGTYTISAYCNEGPRGCVRCCGRWAKFGRFADGTPVHVRHDRDMDMLEASQVGLASRGCPRPVAAPRSIPLGTLLWIEGVGECIVRDRLARRYDHRIDLFFQTHQDAQAWGLQEKKVWRMK